MLCTWPSLGIQSSLASSASYKFMSEQLPPSPLQLDSKERVYENLKILKRTTAICLARVI